MRRRNNPNGASSRVLGPPAARQRGEGGRNPVAEKTAKASQTLGRDGLYNTKEASAAKERAHPRTRTRGRRRVEWLGPHNEGAEGRVASTVYEASTDTRECASRTSRRRRRSRRSRRRRRSRRSRRSRRASREHSLWSKYLYTRVRVEDEPKKAEGDEGDAESHYTMADSVCAGGTVERTRRTARPRTAGTACSSWSEGVPRDFSLEASKAPVLFHQKWCFGDACWSWLGARPRTALWQTGGNGTHAIRSAVGRAVGRA